VYLWVSVLAGFHTIYMHSLRYCITLRCKMPIVCGRHLTLFISVVWSWIKYIRYLETLEDCTTIASDICASIFRLWQRSSEHLLGNCMILVIQVTFISITYTFVTYRMNCYSLFIYVMSDEDLKKRQLRNIKPELCSSQSNTRSLTRSSQIKLNAILRGY